MAFNPTSPIAEPSCPPALATLATIATERIPLTPPGTASAEKTPDQPAEFDEQGNFKLRFGDGYVAEKRKREIEREKVGQRDQKRLKAKYAQLDGTPPYLLCFIEYLQNQYAKRGSEYGIELPLDCQPRLYLSCCGPWLILTRIKYTRKNRNNKLEYITIPLDYFRGSIGSWKPMEEESRPEDGGRRPAKPDTKEITFSQKGHRVHAVPEPYVYDVEDDIDEQLTAALTRSQAASREPAPPEEQVESSEGEQSSGTPVVQQEGIMASLRAAGMTKDTARVIDNSDDLDEALSDDVLSDVELDGNGARIYRASVGPTIKIESFDDVYGLAYDGGDEREDEGRYDQEYDEGEMRESSFGQEDDGRHEGDDAGVEDDEGCEQCALGFDTCQGFSKGYDRQISG